MTDLEKLSFNLQERTVPYFSSGELQNLLDVHEDVWSASYFGCLMKAQANDQITLPGGLQMPSNSTYWWDLAEKYRIMMPTNEQTDGNDGNGSGYGGRAYMTRIDGQ